jgi:pimeloyl-ACP methyl ester carboxylesterase
MLPLAERFNGYGYNCILFDSRANGESGGRYCTFGYYEKRDISRIIDAILSRYGNVVPFGIFGNSLGAAIGVQAAEINKRIACAVVTSPFSTLREIGFDYMKRITSIPFRFVSDMSLDRSGAIANFPIDSVNPEVSARNVAQPVLVIHGSDDRYVSPEYGMRVYRNLASPNKEWYEVAGAGHDDVQEIGGSEYESRIKHFFLTFLHK